MYIYCRKSTFYEDVYKHFDFTIKLKKHNRTIDIKSIKQIRKKFQDEYFYIELTNDICLKGWIYAETMDLVGFECFNNFMIYKRKDILKFINNKGINNFQILRRNNKKKFGLYSETILIKKSELEDILYYRLDKPSDFQIYSLPLPVATSKGLGS